MLRYVRHLHYTVRTIRVAVSTTLLCHWVVLCYVRSLEDKAKSHNTHSNGSSRTGHFRKQYTPSCWPFLCLFSTYMYTWARNYLNATRIKENEFDCIDARGTIAEVGFTTFTLGKKIYIRRRCNPPRYTIFAKFLRWSGADAHCSR
jgi:hypothetical protein